MGSKLKNIHVNLFQITSTLLKIHIGNEQEAHYRFPMSHTTQKNQKVKKSGDHQEKDLYFIIIIIFSYFFI